MSDYFPDQPYIVIDQNRCRDKQEVERLFRRCEIENLRLVLPDIAIFEFSKGTKPHLTWRTSLEHICLTSDLVVAGRDVGNMMSEEITTGKLTEDVIDHKVTPLLQELLSELKTGDDTRLNSALAKIAKFIDTEKALREQHTSNTDIVVDLKEHWKSSLDEATLQKLRNKEKGVFAGILSELETASIVTDAARRDGCDIPTATSITVGPSIYSHAVYALAALALDWLAFGGIESIAPDKVTNDFHDIDYIVIATYCRSLQTNDDRANRVYSGLRDGLEQRLVFLREIAKTRKDAESGREST
jgi:hypothetical protein